MYTIDRFDNLGARTDSTAPVSGGTAVKAITTAGASSQHRRAVSVKNNGSYNIWGYLSQSDTAPTISSTIRDFEVVPGGKLTIAAGSGVRVWLISSDASNTVAFSALELL